MAAIIGTKIDEEELLRQQREAERIAEEERKRAEAEAKKNEEMAAEAAAVNEQAARDAEQKAKEAAAKAQRQGFDRTVREYSKGVDVDIVKAGEFDHLPVNLEEEREQLEKANRAGEMGRGTSFGVTNEIDVNYNSIKSNDQAVFFATTLATDADKLKFFKEYAKNSGQNYEAVLAYADDRLGTKIFATPQSNAGKREAMTSALDGIGLLDINGNDVNVGTADFDTIVQSLNNIADEDKAKKAAAYVESLTKIPGSPYYGMTFDKDAVAYRDSANLPGQTYKDEVKAMGGSFYTGKEAFAGNMETYLAKYEELQAVYGGDPFAFRQVERALKDAYEKQTGYRAPDSEQVKKVIEQTKAERALAAQAEAAESNKGFFDKVADAWNKIFPKEKKEEEEEIAPVEAEVQAEQPYAFRSGYVASAGPMSSGLLAENDRIAEAVESAAPQTEEPAVEAPAAPEMQGPTYQPKPVDKVEVTQNQPPMTYMQAMAAHNRGEELSPENEAIIADSLKNDDFMRYVVNGMTPDPQQIMQERAYGGTVLSDAQARIRANSMTTGRQILGTTLGSVAEALGTGAMPEDVIGAGYQLMYDLMNGVSREIRSGRIAVPAGENKYDYVIANTPRLQKQAEQLAGLQKEVEGIMATRAIEAAHDYDKKVEDAETRYLKGIATQEDLMMLHSRANPNSDINDDETRMQFLAQLSGRSMWYQDDGAFWKGDSAAAQAGMRLRETRADGQYGDFKSALWDKAHDVIDELTYIAMDHGMTLGGWMEKVGLNIDDPSDIMDMAYNRIEAEGAKIAGDQEAQDAANALTNVQTQGVGWMGARWGGFKHGLADDAYHFMNAGYLLMDEATYDARRNEIYNECVSEYGIELAPKVRRQILTAYAKSGVMGEEKSQELLEDIERCDSIWDIPVDVVPGMIEGLYLTGLNKIDKYVEELESVRAYLPENEAKAWDRYFVLGTNTGSGVRQRVTQLGAMALGVPYSVAKNLGLVVGYGFNTISQGTEKYESAGLPRSVAMQMVAAEAFGMIVVNALGEDTVMSSLNGRSLMRNGMETAYRKGTWIGLAKEAAKKTLASAGTEAVQEVLEEGTSKTVEMFVPTAKALSNGEQVSFSKSLQMAWDEFKGMDGKELYKDLLQAGWGGAVFGGFYAAVGMAFETPRSVANAKLQAQYPSIDIASQIAHGELPANEENMGRFIDLMREDVQKPEFRALMDKKNDSADQASYVTVAAVLGEGKEFRDNALKLTQTANQYDQKAEAAEKAVEINRSQFYTARKAAMDGNQGAAVTMEGFRTAWAKAQTTATENRQAAQKKREEAAEQTGRWIYACRKLGDNMHSLTKVRASNLLMYKEQEAQADEMEPQLAEAEANVEAMGVEAFIEQNYNNASDAEKDHIREIWGVPVNTKKEAKPAEDTVAENVTEQEAPVAENETSEQTEQAEQTAEPAAAAAPQTPSEALAEPTAQTTAEPAAEPVQSAQPETAAPAKPMQTMTGAERLNANRKRRLRAAEQFAGHVKRRFGVDVEIAPANDARLMLPEKNEKGEDQFAPALYNRKEDKIIVSENATQGDVLRAKIVHELTHRTEGTEAYKEFSKAVLSAYYKSNENITAARNARKDLYASKGVQMDEAGIDAELVAYATEKLIGGNEEMVNRIVADNPSVARRIMDAIKTVLDKLRGVKGADVDQLRAVEKMFQKAIDEAATQKRPFSSDNIQYSLREKEPPKNVVYAYKAFYARDGKLYPPMVANITDEADKQKVKGATSGTMKSLPTPVGVWLDADIGGIMTDESGAPVRSKDTKRLRVKNDKSGGGATLAFRPGWHLGEWPDAKQFNKADPETGERGKRMPDDLVFAKCEVSADVDYQLDALSYGLNNKGGFSRSQAGLPYVPDDGYYKYRTNVDPTTAPWLIAGSIKVVEILDDADCARICAEFGVTPDQRYSGKPIDLSEYGLKRGPVEATTEGMEQFKENDANRANKKLLENALNDPEYADAYVQREIDFDNPKQYEQLQKEFAMNGQDIEAYRKKYETEGFASSGRAKVDTVSKETGEPLTGTLRGGTEVQYSLDSWTPEEQSTVRSNLINKGYDEDTVDNWIDDVNSIAAIVAADRDRLDFEAADNQVMLKPNEEYVRTLDASTLCAKRLLYQGTFNAIQHRMPNKVMTSDDLIRLRNMMAEAGYETPCGICYVESRRRNLGTFAQKWLKGYDAKGGYQPKLDDVTTTDGLERMRIEHPEVYESFVNEMKRKGSNNPKVVQLRTDYRGDIRKLSKSDIEKIIKIGGLRVQSFSDFETPHLLDMMQAVLDMTENNLTSQAYTKVPNFAWVFGDTGIKINLSLIAEGDGFDADGNLAFSSYEGMDFDEAMRLRDRYSKNAGTILVGLSDKHIRAAMADPRIDFIIPFHKSGWGKRQLSQLSGMSGYMDYTRDQNERRIIGETKTSKPKTKNVEENFHPVYYWNYDLTGDQNAETYLRMCEEDGRIPKFSRFLTKDADGHWVAPSGYWKLLIDFKMYDNDGVGAPQMPVRPNFNMVEARRILGEYEGGANELPVAHDIVERFVNQTEQGSVQYSVDINEPSTLPDDDYLRAEIDAWRSNPNYSVDDNTGKRQFANQTIQNNQYIPDYIKQAFLNDPAKSDYSRESNMRHLNEAWNRVQSEGFDAAVNRLVNQETKFTTEDNADALIIMRQALHDGDLDTLMSVATKYNTEGTDQAKALQIRRLMRTMTPTGFAQTVIQDISRKIEDRETKRPGEKRRRERESRKTKEDLNLGSLDDTSAADTLKSGSSIVIDTKFGAALNDAKRALIKEFGLEKTARPGDFYNWATTKQRMLEDILTTDDIWAKDSNGMDLVDRLVRMKHGEPVLTKADLAYITEQMGIFDRLADKNSREADLALARAHEAQGNINGATGRMKRRTWRYVSMLLSVPSAIRNVIGNTAQSLPNSFADGIAVSLDQAISFAFGTERTRAHISAKERIEGWDAFRNEVFNTFRDYFVDKAITQYGEGRYNQSQIGRVYQTQSLETLRHLEGLLMSVGDRTFWKKKFLNSMAEQQHLAEINGTAFDVEAAMEIAEAEANYATFNEDSTVRNLMSSLTEHIPFLDYLMPFVGVPTNIIKRQIEFSPIGIASTAIRHGWAAVRGESFDQRAFVDGMARGLTGSAMMGIGALLLKSGFLKLGTKEEDDDKSYGVRTAQGDQYGVYFTIGDKNYSITTFSPAASALVAGAFFADAMGDNERWTQALINATLKNINEIFDASYMSSLADALNTSNGKTFTENLIPAIGSAMISQNIPAPLTHLATSLDPYVRDTKDKDAMMEILNTTLNKIPGARQLLPKKVDVSGRAVENTKQGIAAFVDPFTTSKAVGDPALDEMIRLRDELEKKGASEPRAHMASDALSGRRNTLTQNKVTYTVTPEEKEAYRKLYGDLWRNGGITYDKKGKRVSITQGVEELIQSRAYQLMSDEEKAEAIKKILQKAKEGATYQIMNHK